MSEVIRHRWQEIHTETGLQAVFCDNCGLRFSAANDWGRQDSEHLVESELPTCVEVLRRKLWRQKANEGGV